MSNPITVSAHVDQAIKRHQPVVVLESALITHGFAYPASVEITQQMADAIRMEGALPAVVGIWHGQPTVGLSMEQIDAMAQDAHARKISIRDLPLIRLYKSHGGTTVATTAWLASQVGLKVFATGGIGGIHRGHPEDVSADLPVLASTPMVVTCAGAKSILDLPRTLEYLETVGVPVVGWQTEEFPAFYSRSSGLMLDARVDTAAQVAEAYMTQRYLGLDQAVLLTVPVPEEHEVPQAEVEPLIDKALAECDSKGIRGKAVTPYLLARMVELSEDSTKRANMALLVNNSRVAAKVSVALADYEF